MPKNIIKQYMQKSYISNIPPIWKRLLSFIIDILILEFFIIGSFRIPISKLIGNNKGIMETYTAMQQNLFLTEKFTAIIILISLLSYFYFVLLEYLIGQTPGKIILKLKTIKIPNLAGKKEYNTIPKFWQCLIRSLFIFPITPFIFLWILDPLFFFFSPNKQRLIEYLSKTVVVQEQKSNR